MKSKNFNIAVAACTFLNDTQLINRSPNPSGTSNPSQALQSTTRVSETKIPNIIERNLFKNISTLILDKLYGYRKS